MSIFDQASKAVSEKFKDMQKKTNDSIQEKKLVSQIKDAKDEIATLYRVIGEKAYKERTEAIPEGFSELFSSVQSLEDRIRGYEKEIEKLKSIKRCASCGAQAPIESRFCPLCGSPMEIDEPEETEEEPEEEKPDLCPKCGEEKKPDGKFCIKCGYSFVSPTPEENEEPDTQDE